MASGGYRLGVDFGTSNTIAALAGPDGRVRPLLFDGSPLLASAVFAGPGSGPLVGADALRAAVGYPAGLEPNPKRRVDDGTVWLGEREFPVVELVAAVLHRVGVEATRVAGGAVGEVVLTHPVAWGRARLGLLADAAARAGLGQARFVAEPVAAAAYFAAVLGRRILADRCIVVYDLGAGTFDVSVVRPWPGGFDVVTAAGLPDVGGLDFDAAVVRHARTLTAGTGGAWQRLDWPRHPGDQQARQTLWQAARAVKEQLSRHATGDLYVPLVDSQVHLTREEFEQAARPHLERTASLTVRVLAEAGVPPEDVDGVFLVGGSSRIPLAATLLHRTLRIAPTVIDQPELVVAEGALHTYSTAAPAAAVAPPVPAAVAPPAAAPAPASTRRRWRRAVAALAACAVLATAGVLAVTRPWEGPAFRTVEPLGAPLRGHTDWVNGVVFSPDGKTVASVSSDSSTRLWDVAGRAPARDPFTRQRGFLYSVAFSPDGRAIATGGDHVRLWNVTGTPVGEPLIGHTGYVHGVAFSPDGSLLAAGGDKVVRLWDPRDGRRLGDQFAGHTADIRGLAFSPDGKTLATVGEDGTLRLWDVTNRTAIGGPLTGHTGVVHGVAFSPDGRTVATAGEDETLRLWDTASRQPIGDPGTGHTGWIRAPSARTAGRWRRPATTRPSACGASASARRDARVMWACGSGRRCPTGPRQVEPKPGLWLSRPRRSLLPGCGGPARSPARRGPPPSGGRTRGRPARRRRGRRWRPSRAA